jgi:hypothetical protein
MDVLVAADITAQGKKERGTSMWDPVPRHTKPPSKPASDPKRTGLEVEGCQITGFVNEGRKSNFDDS